MRLFSNIISFIFNPIFVPLLAFYIYLQFEHFNLVALTNIQEYNEGNPMLTIILMIAIFTIFLPLASMNLMIAYKIIPDFHLRNHKDRPPVIIMSAAFMTGLMFLFLYLERKSNLEIFHEFYGVIFAAIILALVTAIVSFFWQISMHLTCMSGLCGAMFGLSVTMYPIQNMDTIILINSGLLLAVGLTGVARLYLNAHNLSQILAGTVLGFTVEFLVITQGWYL